MFLNSIFNCDKPREAGGRLLLISAENGFHYGHYDTVIHIPPKAMQDKKPMMRNASLTKNHKKHLVQSFNLESD